MLCNLCGIETNCIYTMSKYGFICGDCYRKTRNSNEGQLKQREEVLKMRRKYGLDIKE